MAFVPITDKSEIALLQRKLARALQNQAACVGTRIAMYQGGSEPIRPWWSRNNQFWFYLNRRSTKFWNIFGLQDPHSERRLRITVEINPPIRGVNRRLAGCFLRGPDGHAYVAHTGRIGGGQKGVGKKLFEKFYSGVWQNVIWPDRKQSIVIPIGRVDSSDLAFNIRTFVLAVSAFKALDKKAILNLESGIKKFSFKEEFAGKKQYPLGGKVVAECKHGEIVFQLKKALKFLHYDIGNSQPIDLFLHRQGALVALFEVKTDLDTTSVYKAVGQLLVNSAANHPRPALIAVFPGILDANQRSAFKKLGIELVSFSEKPKGHYKFRQLFVTLDHALHAVGSSKKG